MIPTTGTQSAQLSIQKNIAHGTLLCGYAVILKNLSCFFSSQKYATVNCFFPGSEFIVQIEYSIVS